MTTGDPSALRTFAFGDLDTSLWGCAVAWDAGTVASFGDPLEIDAGAATDEWTIGGAGVELRFNATGEPCRFGPAAAGVDGFAQLCRVEGSLYRDGSEHEVACFGIRSSIALPTTAPGSVRATQAWFGPDDGFALVALRPSRAKGHDADAVACALFEDGDPLDVDEPRLSTAYTAAGAPARASLELWLAGSDDDERDRDDGDEDGDDDQAQRDRARFPRRAAGEQAGDGSHLRAATVNARADLFRWHWRGREGAGVYVLVPAS